MLWCLPAGVGCAWLRVIANAHISPSMLNPIHAGGGGDVFHLQASKLLRTQKPNKPSP